MEREAITHSERRQFGQVEINVCKVEDLIIFKLFAARDKDMADVKTLIATHKAKLDISYLRKRVREFIVLERSDVIERLEALLQ